ncbi:site-specific integrase [uncultured Peptoniphilus sp.]|uniref:site-specific integrase n=1 Tax=uncultured Peptoniphilus sp. TaxID=254354 RepID=UPI002596D162|nr:site-specific integrase [uncultured Peptoniphilus sp.]
MNITIRQRENGKWQAIVSYKDKKGKWRQKPKGGFDKRKDANQWAKEKYFELQRLERKGILGNSYTLREVFETYLSVMDNKNSKDTSNTQENYGYLMKLFSDFMDKDINTIKSTELLKFIDNKRRETGHAYNSNIVTLNIVFNFAIKKLKVCENNPCDILYKDNSKKDERIKFITENFYYELLNDAKREKLKLFLRMLYETGMRISEGLGVCTQTVIDCSIKIDRQFNSKKKKITYILKTNNSYRTAPISAELYKDLKKATCDIDGRIFYDLTYDQVYYLLKKKNTSPHCFRHTRATLLVSAGIDLTIIAYIIGDKIETILNEYVERNDDRLESSYDKIRQIL